LRRALKPSRPALASVTPDMKALFDPSWSGTATYHPLERAATSSIVFWTEETADPVLARRE
jgi:hypothetical protein